jgi:GxxExxY protein
VVKLTTEAQRSRRFTENNSRFLCVTPCTPFLCGKKAAREMITQKIINDISYRIIGCAIEVHKHLGPGLLESIYHNCMMDELLRNDLAFQSHVAVPINYKGRQLAEPLRLDLLVEDIIVLELKATEAIHPVYSAQLLSYLKLADKPKGLLINFHTENIAQGTISLVTELFRSYPK